jgi:hypothetical protein
VQHFRGAQPFDDLKTGEGLPADSTSAADSAIRSDEKSVAAAPSALVKDV